MAQNFADLGIAGDGRFSELLSQTAVDKAGAFNGIARKIAIPWSVPSSSYAKPVYASRRTVPVSTAASNNGGLNQRSGIAPTFVEGKTKRRGLKDFIDDDTRDAENGFLLGDESQLTEDITDELLLEEEIRLKAALDAVVGVSGHYASPSVKWDAASSVVIKTNMTTAMRAAELNSEQSLQSGKWKWIIPPLVADVIANDAEVLNRIRYTHSDLLVNGQLPPQLWGIDVMIPDAVSLTNEPGQSATTGRIWTTDNVYLVFVNPAFANSRRAFTALATAQWAKRKAYDAYSWRPSDLDIKRTYVGVETHDALDVISQDGIYVLSDVLT